ncbi:MAG: hypothetical protein CSA42_02660 [Gammaproteobacteria bacterium]|nr:MAG: hypothetical protein CSA42_02660 [Gammaproteobacteria bacterium]
MNINIVEQLATAIAPKILGANADRSEASLLNQFIAIILGRFTDDSVFSTVLEGYNKITGNGNINLDDIGMDSLSELASSVWSDKQQSIDVLQNLASNHGVGESKVKGIMVSALPLILSQVKGLAGDAPVPQFLREQPKEDDKSFLSFIPNWATGLLPAGLLGAATVAAVAPKQDVKVEENTQPAYVSDTKTTTTPVTTAQNDNNDNGGGFLRGLLPLLGLLILAALAWAMLKACPSEQATAPAAEESAEVAEELAPSTLNVAVNQDGVASVNAETGTQEIADTIKTSLTNVFGDDVANAANISVSDKLAANLPVAEKLGDVLNVVKGVPGSAASIVGQTIKVNAPDAGSRDKLVADLKGLLPDFTVEGDEGLDIGSLTGTGAAMVDGVKEGAKDVAGAVDDSITAAQDALNGLTDNLTGEGLEKALNLQIINFATNDSAIPEKNQVILNKAAEVMKKMPEAQLTIIGHTDDRGDDAYNQKLSEKRANSVKAYLVEQGVDADHIMVEGAGETKPIADNGTAEGRFQNRRIEFQVIGDGKAVASAGNAEEKTTQATVEETESK